jgi:hypothetical protein
MATKNGVAKKNNVAAAIRAEERESDRQWTEVNAKVKAALAILDAAFQSVGNAVSESGHGLRFKGEVIVFCDAPFDPKSEKFLRQFDDRFGGTVSVVRWIEWEG